MEVVDSLKPRPGLKALVTAGASGIGAAIATAFAHAGASVHICDVDRTATEAFTARNPGITSTLADVSIADEVDQVIDDAMTAMGGLDVLVNNAGIAGPTGAVSDISIADWDRTVAVNLNSQFYFARRAVPLLAKSSADPHIVVMSSVAGRLGYGFRTPYSSTKWALIGLMKTLAIELGPQAIRVNAVLPGVVEGDRMDRVIKARAATMGVSVEAMRETYLEKISLHRMVSADDIAALALFLSSPGARNITGQAISVDGNVEYL